MVHPCCGSSLQQGTKFLAMLSMMLSVIGTAAAAFFISLTLFSGPKTDDARDTKGAKLDEGGHDSYTIITMFVDLILFIFNLFLAILLFIAAEQKNLRLLDVWLKISIALVGVDLLLLAKNVLFPTPFDPHPDIPYADIVVNSCGILYSLYELWVVYAFITETKILKDVVSGSPTVNTTV